MYKPHNYFTAIFLSSLFATASLNAAAISGVAYGFANTQASASDEAILSSISFQGMSFDNFIFPDTYSNISITGNAQIRLNSTDLGVAPADVAWEPTASSAFQDANLNHYQQLDEGNFNSTWRLDFGNSLQNVTADEAFFVITDRNLNNTYGLEAFNASGVSLGILSVQATDYEATGALSFSTDLSTAENIGGAVFALTDVIGSSSPSDLAYIEITNDFSTDDGGDGKVLLITSAVPEPSTLMLTFIGAFSLLRRRR